MDDIFPNATVMKNRLRFVSTVIAQRLLGVWAVRRKTLLAIGLSAACAMSVPLCNLELRVFAGHAAQVTFYEAKIFSDLLVIVFGLGIANYLPFALSKDSRHEATADVLITRVVALLFFLVMAIKVFVPKVITLPYAALAILLLFTAINLVNLKAAAVYLAAKDFGYRYILITNAPPILLVLSTSISLTFHGRLSVEWFNAWVFVLASLLYLFALGHRFKLSKALFSPISMPERELLAGSMGNWMLMISQSLAIYLAYKIPTINEESNVRSNVSLLLISYTALCFPIQAISAKLYRDYIVNGLPIFSSRARGGFIGFGILVLPLTLFLLAYLGDSIYAQLLGVIVAVITFYFTKLRQIRDSARGRTATVAIMKFLSLIAASLYVTTIAEMPDPFARVISFVIITECVGAFFNGFERSH